MSSNAAATAQNQIRQLVQMQNRILASQEHNIQCLQLLEQVSDQIIQLLTELTPNNVPATVTTSSSRPIPFTQAQVPQPNQNVNAGLLNSPNQMPGQNQNVNSSYNTNDSLQSYGNPAASRYTIPPPPAFNSLSSSLPQSVPVAAGGPSDCVRSGSGGGTCQTDTQPFNTAICCPYCQNTLHLHVSFGLEQERSLSTSNMDDTIVRFRIHVMNLEEMRRSLESSIISNHPACASSPVRRNQ